MPYAFKQHGLFDHLEATANRALKYLSSMNEDVMSRRFKGLGYEITSQRIRFLVQASSLLHDIGKAADCYQERLEREESPSFIYHELPSAVICYRVLKKRGNPEEESLLASLVVLQHMSTTRDWLSDSHQVFFKRWTFSKFSMQVQEFLVDKIGFQTQLEVERGQAFELVARMQRLIREKHYGWLKLYTLLLAPLSTADNLDAFENRKDKIEPQRKWFIEELKSIEEA